jgi:hypothetical protein
LLLGPRYCAFCPWAFVLGSLFLAFLFLAFRSWVLRFLDVALLTVGVVVLERFVPESSFLGVLVLSVNRPLHGRHLLVMVAGLGV